MEDLQFNIVESEYYRKGSKYAGGGQGRGGVTRPTLMKYLSLVHNNILDRLGMLIPNRFGAIFDGHLSIPVSICLIFL
jgi:hypothetical protein